MTEPNKGTKTMVEDTGEYTVSTPELAECARINFQNIARMAPALGSHPIFIMAMDQLSAVVKRLNEPKTDV